jgi:hypothetical protein
MYARCAHVTTGVPSRATIEPESRAANRSFTDFNDDARLETLTERGHVCPFHVSRHTRVFRDITVSGSLHPEGQAGRRAHRKCCDQAAGSCYWERRGGSEQHWWREYDRLLARCRSLSGCAKRRGSISRDAGRRLEPSRPEPTRDDAVSYAGFVLSCPSASARARCPHRRVPADVAPGVREFGRSDSSVGRLSAGSPT